MKCPYFDIQTKGVSTLCMSCVLVLSSNHTPYLKASLTLLISEIQPSE